MGWGNKGGGDRDVYDARRVPFYGSVSTLLSLIEASLVVCGWREKKTVTPSPPPPHALIRGQSALLSFGNTGKVNIDPFDMASRAATMIRIFICPKQ